MLKGIFSFLLIFCFISSSLGEEAKNYEEAIALSQQTNKPIFLYFGAEWCGYCKKMEKVFEDKTVSQEMENFIFLKLDRDASKEVAKKYGVKSIPDYMILDQNENINKRHTGYKDNKEFINWLK